MLKNAKELPSQHTTSCQIETKNKTRIGAAANMDIPKVRKKCKVEHFDIKLCNY